MMFSRKALALTFASVLAVALVVVPVPVPAQADTPSTYYVSASGGDDSNAGTESTSAWRTLTKVSSITFSPGDQILLKGGDTWDGEDLALHGSGAPGLPIVLSSYGVGRPHVRNTDTAVVQLRNEDGWIISGLEVEIASTETLSAGKSWRQGIRVEYDDGGSYSDVSILDNLIYGSEVDRSTDGILVTASVPTGLEHEVLRGLRIEGNTVHHVGWRGIDVSAWDPWKESVVYTSSVFYDVKINRNTVHHTGNQGIVLENSNHSSIKWNLVHHGGQYSLDDIEWGPGGIWPIKSSYIDVKFNEVYGMSDSGTGYDAAGLNLDWTCEFCSLEYNYAHDNLALPR